MGNVTFLEYLVIKQSIGQNLQFDQQKKRVQAEEKKETTFILLLQFGTKLLFLKLNSRAKNT